MTEPEQIELLHTQLPSQQDLRALYDHTYRTQGLADPARLYRWIIGLLQPAQHRRLLDVACGEGHLLWHAHDAQLVPAGVDLSFEAVKWAMTRCPQAGVCVADGEQLPFPDGSFDDVTSLGSLEHYREMEQGLREMGCVLKPDGLACVMVPNLFWLGDILEVLWRGECSSAFQIIERHGTRRGWQRLLEAQNLAVVRFARYNKPYPLFAPSSWKVKSIRKFIWRRLFTLLCPFNLSLEFVYLCRKRNG